MNPGDPNELRVEVVAAALGDLCEELVLVGGCAASQLIDAPSAPPAAFFAAHKYVSQHHKDLAQRCFLDER